jgi:hypothetical protein
MHLGVILHNAETDILAAESKGLIHRANLCKPASLALFGLILAFSKRRSARFLSISPA